MRPRKFLSDCLASYTLLSFTIWAHSFTIAKRRLLYESNKSKWIDWYCRKIHQLKMIVSAVEVTSAYVYVYTIVCILLLYMCMCEYVYSVCICAFVHAYMYMYILMKPWWLIVQLKIVLKCDTTGLTCFCFRVKNLKNLKILEKHFIHLFDTPFQNSPYGHDTSWKFCFSLHFLPFFNFCFLV